MYSIHYLSLKLVGTLLNASWILIESVPDLRSGWQGSPGREGRSSSYLNVWWSVHFTRQWILDVLGYMKFTHNPKVNKYNEDCWTMVQRVRSCKEEL